MMLLTVQSGLIPFVWPQIIAAKEYTSALCRPSFQKPLSQKPLCVRVVTPVTCSGIQTTFPRHRRPLVVSSTDPVTRDTNQVELTANALSGISSMPANLSICARWATMKFSLIAVILAAGVVTPFWLNVPDSRSITKTEVCPSILQSNSIGPAVAKLAKERKKHDVTRNFFMTGRLA